MGPEPEKSFRPWVAWLIASVWAAVALVVLIAVRIHPATTADISVNTRKIAFRTNATHLLQAGDHAQLLISGVSAVQIRFGVEQPIRLDSKILRATSLNAEGDSLASCSFYQVRSGGFDVRGPAVITLQLSEGEQTKAFSLRTHGEISDELSSLPAQPGLPSAFECRGLRVLGKQIGTVEGAFYPQGGDTVFLSTSSDARLDSSIGQHSSVGDTQIPILGELRFSEVEPRSSGEKSVLLEPAAEISFDKTNKKVTLKPADLLVVTPKSDFYLRQLKVTDGIHLSLYGKVRDVRTGAGANAMATVLPSAFDQADSATRLLGAIVALTGVVLGILEKMGLLGRK